jgi:hypothetical protein
VHITEITDENEDQFEIQNTGNSPADTAGWFVVAGNSADVDVFNSVVWQLPASLAPGEILRVSEYQTTPGALWFGNSIQWTFALNRGWIMLCDSSTTLRDFFAWGWPAADLAALNFTMNGKTITTAGAWTGDGSPPGARANNNNSWQRIGGSDRNTAADWTFASNATSWGQTNAGLNLPWQTAPVVLLSSSSAAFNGGAFAGFLSTPEPAGAARITANDGLGHTAESSAFDVVAAQADSDGDRMPDAWETANGLNPAANDASADNDGDGSSNRHEYYAGTDPQSSASVLAITSWSAEPPSQLSLAWPVRAGGLYRIRSSADLTNWSFVPGQTYAPAADGTQAATFPRPASGESRFYQVQLVTPP